MKQTILIICIIVAGLYISFKPPYVPNLVNSDSKNESSEVVEYYLNNIQSRKFNSNGELAIDLSSTSAGKNTNNKHLEIIQPKLQVATKSNQWMITAKQGEFNPKQQIIVLNKDVVLKDRSNQGTIHTEQLTVDNKQQRVHNDKALSIKTETSITTATGLNVSLKDESLELLSNVKTEYNPIDAADTKAPQLK